MRTDRRIQRCEPCPNEGSLAPLPAYSLQSQCGAAPHNDLADRNLLHSFGSLQCPITIPSGINAGTSACRKFSSFPGHIMRAYWMAQRLDRSAYSANMHVNKRLCDKDHSELLIRCFIDDYFTYVHCRAVEVGELRSLCSPSIHTSMDTG